MNKIPLPHDLFVLVDEPDYERMNQWNWYVALSDKANGLQQTVRVLHTAKDETIEFGQTLLGYDKESEYLTFQNHNRLDFRRENLLVIPIQYAKFHSASQTNSSSRYKGVHYSTSKQRYIASLTVDGKKQYIGSSRSEDEAAILYNTYTKRLFGDYAFQNIIGEDNRKPLFDTEKVNLPRQTKNIQKEWRGVFPKEQGYQASIKGEYLGTYESAEDAAYAYNVRATSLYGERAILNELPPGFIGARRKREFSLFGKTYYSLDEVARAIDIPKTTLHNRLKRMSLVEAVAMGKAEPKLRLPNTSMRSLAAKHGVNRHRLASLLKEGMTVEEAIHQLTEKKQTTK